MKKLGFKKSIADNALYYKKGCIVAVYVDDLLITGSMKDVVKVEKANLMKFYAAKDLGILRNYLGFEWFRNRKQRTSVLLQEKYCEDLLQRFNMENAKSQGTPILPGTDLGSRKQMWKFVVWYSSRHIICRKYSESLYVQT